LTYPERKLPPSAESGNSKTNSEGRPRDLCKRSPPFATGSLGRNRRAENGDDKVKPIRALEDVPQFTQWRPKCAAP
jgi:hypothetical protein